jgi:hypothetical protein
MCRPKNPGPCGGVGLIRQSKCDADRELLHVAVGRLTEESTGRRKGSHVDARVHVLRQGRRVAIGEADAEDARMVRGGTRRLAVRGRQQFRVRIGVVEAGPVRQSERDPRNLRRRLQFRMLRGESTDGAIDIGKPSRAAPVTPPCVPERRLLRPLLTSARRSERLVAFPVPKPRQRTDLPR